MSSSGALFVDVLRRLEYPAAKKLQAEGFDWLFDNEESVPFLDWFCKNVSAANLLTSQELKEFQALKSSDAEILSGSQLDAALEVACMTQEEDLTNEEIKAEIDALENELRAADKRKAVLIHHRNKLSLQQTSLTHKVSKLGATESRSKRRYKEIKEQQQTATALLNSSLDDLSASTSDLVKLYHSPGDLASAPFLSQTNLQHYHLAEDKFTQELKVFTKKQFFEGIADLAGYSQNEDFKLLDISDPQNLLLKGEESKIREGERHELDRLKSLYTDSQKVSMRAAIEAKRVEAALRYAEECVQSAQDVFHGDVKALSDRLQDVQRDKQKVKQETERLWRNVIPDLLQANVELQATHVLYGDYNLKILRQNYFTSKQDMLIRQLVVQRARNYFLGMGYEVENQVHQKIHREICAVEQMLEEHHRDHQARLSMMSDSCLVVPKSPRNTVNSRDTFITHLSNIMKSSAEMENQQLFLTFQDILESASHLGGRLHKLRDALKDSTQSQDNRITVLEQHLSACEASVYDKTALPEVQLLLTPPQIQNGINQLDRMIQNIEQSILEIMGEYNNKTKVLKGDPLEARQRQFFVYFFTQPAQLRREIKALTDRLQALSVS
ncbi:HAUS augmin-like complex subunit 3 [Holothuria leucospilota]|uniref:HAUS augmin-like complex subunit 3 n=1 Tax=Holothuria leucospilota TaxID=206669 RepID=A0A9Q1C958_HOLLE|nr:HAUS augmin-like complex subunit 3 [Holothuria leucospilota]